MKNLIILATILSMLFGQSVSARTYNLTYNPMLTPKYLTRAVTNPTTDKVHLELLDVHSVQIFSIGMRGLGICTGTLIAEIGNLSYVLTARHCAGAFEEVRVENNLVIGIITSATDDLMLLIVKGKIEGKLPIESFQFPSIGDKVHFVGHNNLIPDKMYTKSGRIIRKTKDWYWAELLSIGGCSGSGVFNSSFGLVGVLWGGTAKVTAFEPVQDILEFLNSLNIKGLVK